MTAMPKSPADLLVVRKPLTLSSVPEGAEGFVVADLARAWAARPNVPARDLLVICRDGTSMAALSRALAFFAPEVEVATVPAWDCLPYDRASPHTGIVAERMAAMSRLAAGPRKEPLIVLTTVNAAVQRVPARELVAKQSLIAAPGNAIPMDRIIAWLELNGFLRASTVREPGEYAVRGGILDLFAPGMDLPVRLDFFGDTLEIDPQLRCGNPAQRRPAARPQAGAGRRIPAHQGDDPPVPPGLPRPLRRAAARRPALCGGERRPAPHGHGALAAAVPRAARDAVRLLAGCADRARAARRGRRRRTPDSDRRLLRGTPRAARRGRAALPSVAAGCALPGRSRMARTAGARRAGAPDAVRRPRDVRGRRRHRRPPGPQFRRRAGRAEPQPVRRRHRPRAGPAGRWQARRRRVLERGRARAHEPRAGRPWAAQSRAGGVVGGSAGAAEAGRRPRRARAGVPGSRPRASRSSASRTFWATGWCGRVAPAGAPSISSPR